MLFLVLSLAVYLALIFGGRGLLQPVSAERAVRWGALGGELGRSEPWRYLSAIFVHFTLLHVAFNLLALVSFGRSLEQAIGAARFAVLLLLSGIGGFVLSEFWYTFQPLTGGMSGGIFGLLGAEVGLRYAGRDVAWKKSAISALGYGVAAALLPGQSVNNAAHFGGLIVGAAFGWVLFRAGWNLRADRAFGILAALLLLATVGAIAHGWLAYT
jgi:rhomboid protease GluP